MIVAHINMNEFKASMKKLSPYLNEDTNQRVQQKLKKNQSKVFSESHIQKVRAGHKYVKSIVDAILEVATENRKAYEQQMRKISSFA